MSNVFKKALAKLEGRSQQNETEESVVILTNPPKIAYPSPQQAKALNEAFYQGLGLYEACNVAKVPPRQFYNWLFLSDYLDNFETYEALTLVSIRMAYQMSFEYRSKDNEAFKIYENTLKNRGK